MKQSVFFFLMLSLNLYSQTNISGYVKTENEFEKPQKIFISTKNSIGEYIIIASADIDSNGFFNINKELDSNIKLYKISVNNTAEDNSKYFLLSNNDSLSFGIGEILFNEYNNTNSIDNEWQKFNKFREDLNINQPKNYLKQIRQYSEDSLKTLAIKLLSVKELHEKNLLQEDILVNMSYYLRFLEELKSSEINNLEYFFLENELALQSLKKAEQKYKLSKVIILILVLIIALTILFYLFNIKRTNKNIEELSKQEINVKKHIIEGKSNKEIAKELFISLSTVKTHITNIYNKLNVSNRNELITKFGK